MRLLGKGDWRNGVGVGGGGGGNSNDGWVQKANSKKMEWIKTNHAEEEGRVEGAGRGEESTWFQYPSIHPSLF